MLGLPGRTQSADRAALYTVLGGGSLPLVVFGGRVNASRPLVRLSVYPDGVSVELRPRWLQRLCGAVDQPIQDGEKRYAWSARWDQLSYVSVARRSVYLQPAAGRGCRFESRTKAPIDALRHSLEEHDVTISPVTSTIGKTFTL